MPNQQPNQPAGSNTIIASDGTQLDPTAAALTRAIRQVESKGNYNASGASGEKGAYQWMPGHFEATAKQFGLDPNDFSPVNQDKAAYHAIKAQLDAGHSQSEVASWWNSGSYDPTGKVGTNQEGVSYNTPAYVDRVKQAYMQQIQGQQSNQQFVNPQVQPQPAQAQFVQPPQQQTIAAQNQLTQPTSNNGLLDTLGKVGNFAFPIVGDIANDIQGNSQKTGLQQLGDLGLSALWFAPGVGEVGEGALQGTRLAAMLGETGTKVAGQALGNAGLGYGADIASNLSQGKTDASALMPGLGTITGGGLGAIGGGVSSLLDKVASKTPVSQLESQTNRLKTLQKAVVQNSSKDTNPIKTLNQMGLIKSLKVVNGKIDASALTNADHTGIVDDFIDQHADDASSLVKSLPGKVNLSQFKTDVLSAIENNPTIRDAGKIPQAEAEIERRFASFQRSFGTEAPWEVVDNIRKAMNREYDPALRDVARIIGDTAREYLYNGDSTNTALRSAMTNEAELIRVQNFLQKLHGTTVPGGQLGKYFADMIGAGAGGAVGSIGGPIGAGLGTLAGGVAAHKAAGLVQSSFFDPKMAKVAGLLQTLLAKPGATSIPRAGILKGLVQQ